MLSLLTSRWDISVKNLQDSSWANIGKGSRKWVVALCWMVSGNRKNYTIGNLYNSYLEGRRNKGRLKL
jgi:hypothetical protein